MATRFVAVAGLPRTGSTLLCQLLAQHPDVHSDARSSPLCNTLVAIRRTISDDSFFLSQLDSAFDSSYAHLASAMRGYLRGWHQDCTAPLIVDKNRGWLRAIELLLHIEPEAKLIVCLRELGQIYGSIESQHQRTILVDFIDHLADSDRFTRADILFMKDKTIGSPLTALQAVTDLPKHVQERLYYLRLEDLMEDPAACMGHLYGWLGIPAFDIDFDRLELGAPESDSHYRMKYPHKQCERIVRPARHAIPPRIQTLIETAYPWYYQFFSHERANSLVEPLRIDDEWRRWIAENMLLGGAAATIAATMVRAGVCAEEAAAEVQSAASSPYLVGAERLRNRLDKRNWLIDTRRRLERLLPDFVERRAQLPGDEFLRQYYSAGRPVIITGMLDDWPALGKWNIDFLSRQYAEKVVEIQAGRSADGQYESNKKRHQQTMRFGDFLDWIRIQDSSNDRYLTAYNSAHNSHALAELMEDVRGVPEYLDATSKDQGFLWIGPRGTVTPFHHDLTNNLLAQVIGRKRFVIASSLEISGMYNHEHCFSAVDGRRVDYDRFPEMRGVRLMDLVLEPGELLFLPIGWWHFVEGLEFSISLTFTNFRWNNDFTDAYPKRTSF